MARAEAGKIGEGSVSREREDQQDGTDGDVVEPPSAHDRRSELGEDALVAGAVGIRRADVVEAAERGDAGEKNEEQGDDDGEGAAGVFRGRFAERHDAVADGFDAGHGGAAAGEDAEEQPEAGGGDGGRKLGRRDDGGRMSMAGDGVEEADGNDNEQRTDEQIGRDEEDDAGIADAAHVDEGEQQQNKQADLECVRLEGGYGGNERADAGGDPDRCGEDVVDHERRSGEQTRAIAEVLTGDGEGATTVRIGFDSLGVGEIEDDEQDENCRGDGTDEVNAAEAERNEQGEGGFGPVRGGAESIEAEDRNARGGPDAFGAFFGGGEWPSEQQVGDLHVGWNYPGRIVPITVSNS